MRLAPVAIPRVGVHSSLYTSIASFTGGSARMSSAVRCWRATRRTTARPAVGSMTNDGVTRMRWPDATAAGGSVSEIVSGAVMS